MNTVITFPIAKLLKQKNFNTPTLHYYFENGELKENLLEGTNGYYGEDYSFAYEDLLDDWNTAWVTNKNGERCFGCDSSKGYFKTYSAPTISEVVVWLYEQHGIWITVCIIGSDGFGYWLHGKNRERLNPNNQGELFSSPTEAYLKAIEVLL